MENMSTVSHPNHLCIQNGAQADHALPILLLLLRNIQMIGTVLFHADYVLAKDWREVGLNFLRVEVVEVMNSHGIGMGHHRGERIK
jgi:hypothetical protein